MGRLQRPGDTFVLGAMAAALGLHYNINGWLIVVAVLAAGWALNEEERKIRERSDR